MEQLKAKVGSHHRYLELSTRADKIRAQLSQAGISALVVSSRGHVGLYGGVEFVAGYTPVARQAYALVTPKRGPVLIAPSPGDAWHAKQAGIPVETRVAGFGNILATESDLASAVASVLLEESIVSGRVAIAGLNTIMPVKDYEALKSVLPEVEFVDGDSLLEAVKLVKSELELELIQETAEIADAGYRAGLEKLRVGASESEVVGAIRGEVFRKGARDALIFATAQPYFITWATEDRTFQQGDMVTMIVEVVGPTGYWVEAGGVIALGEPQPEQAELFSACREAMLEAESVMTAGSSAAKVAEAIEAVGVKHNYRAGLWHGHGVGLDHDRPVISRQDQTVLEPGMVIALHPNFASGNDDTGSTAIGTYVVTDGPPIRLSQISRDLDRKEV